MAGVASMLLRAQREVLNALSIKLRLQGGSMVLHWRQQVKEAIKESCCHRMCEDRETLDRQMEDRDGG